MDWQTFRVTLKVGLAVGLAYLPTYGERSHYSLHAVLTAALIVGANFGEDLNQSLVRLVSAVIGVGFLVTLGGHVSGVVAAAVAAAVLSRQVKLEQLSRVTLAVCMVTMLLHPERVVSYGAYRLLNTLIGAGIGLNRRLPGAAGGADPPGEPRLRPDPAGVVGEGRDRRL